MKKLNRLEILKGRMPLVYDPVVFANVVRIINAHSKMINYLAEIVEEQEKKIKLLEKMIERKDHD